jgi:hypothetical protein
MIARGWPNCERNKLFIVPPSAPKRAITVTERATTRDLFVLYREMLNYHGALREITYISL